MIRYEPFSPCSEKTSSRVLRDFRSKSGMDLSRIREVAMAVEKYLQLDTTWGGYVSAEAWLWMVAQALVAAGEDRAAQLWIGQTLAADLAGVAVRCLRCDDRRDAWRWFALGIIRLAPCSFEHGPLWIVDLSRLNAKRGHFYELSWVSGVQKLMRRVVQLWSLVGRHGVLALQGAPALAQSLCGRPTEKARCEQQIQAACREAAMRYAGNQSPELRIVVLDARPRRRTRSKPRGKANTRCRPSGCNHA